MAFMKLKIVILLIIVFQLSSLSSLENSIVPTVEHFENSLNLPSQKFSKNQLQEVQQVLSHIKERIRIVTFNILSDDFDKDQKINKNHLWIERLPRIFELLHEMQPDIIAVQELSERQLSDLMPLLQNYEFYGHPRDQDHEYNGIFYRKNRFIAELHEILTYYDSGEMTNTVTSLQLKDKITEKRFAILNTHLPFSNPNRREFEITLTLKLIKPLLKKMPVLFMGDLNLFPHQLDLPFPFYDGDYIHHLLTAEIFEDSLDKALLGHFGPMATFTNDGETILPFKGQGTPGVIFDRIYVSDKIDVLVHAVQPATVNGFYASDHMPVFIDFLIR